MVVFTLEVEDTFQPQELVTKLGDHRTEPDAYLQGVEVARLLDTDSIDILQMIVMTAVMRMTMAVVKNVMVAVVILELEREVDAADVENRREVHLGILRAMNLGDLVQSCDLMLGLI